MANVVIDDGSLKAIGNSIRGKNGTSVLYTPAEMPGAIDAITGGGKDNIVLSDLIITKPPTKLTYAEGETFSPVGGEFKVDYSNTAYRTNISPTYSPTEPLTLKDQTITFSFSEYGIIKEAKQTITVVEKAFAWGDENTVGDEKWISGLQKEIKNSDSNKLSTYLGKTKKIKLNDETPEEAKSYRVIGYSNNLLYLWPGVINVSSYFKLEEMLALYFQKLPFSGLSQGDFDLMYVGSLGDNTYQYFTAPEKRISTNMYWLGDTDTGKQSSKVIDLNGDIKSARWKDGIHDRILGFAPVISLK